MHNDAQVSPKDSLEAKHWLSDASAFEFTRKIAMPGLSYGYGTVYTTADGSVGLFIAGVARG